jgi:pimeloyl-ACP methyl ester carboxylesterase
VAGYDGAIEEATVHVGAVETFYRRRDGDGIPTVFVHGNPTNSEDWLPFMRGLRGPSLALDLPGWGRSARPDYSSFDGTMNGLAGFIERFLEAVEVREHMLVGHDWGAVGLIAAQRHPERVRRLVALNTVPLSASYRWHWVARRFWRRRGLGEAFNLGARTPLNKPVLRQVMTPTGRAPQDLVDRVARHWDAGTSRAILRLYRSADPDALADAGAHLGELACPGLVIWAGADPFIPSRFGHELAAALPDARLIELPDAGHWPWVERPDVVPMTARFLEGG